MQWKNEQLYVKQSYLIKDSLFHSWNILFSYSTEEFVHPVIKCSSKKKFPRQLSQRAEATSKNDLNLQFSTTKKSFLSSSHNMDS